MVCALVKVRPSVLSDAVFREKSLLLLAVKADTVITQFTAPLEQKYSCPVSDLVLTVPWTPLGSDPVEVTTTCEMLVQDLQLSIGSGSKCESMDTVTLADGTIVLEVSAAPRCTPTALQGTTAGRVENEEPTTRGKPWMAVSIAKMSEFVPIRSVAGNRKYIQVSGFEAVHVDPKPCVVATSVRIHIINTD